jgi:GT2 family glycosyltransferase
MSELNLHKNITIVIVLYQEPFELLSKTLNTINSFKKIIIDNNGNIELKKKIKSQFSVDQYILNKKNNGFSAGYNQGISLSNTEFTLVLGPDCIIKEQDIGILIRKIIENRDCYIVSPTSYDEHNNLTYAGGPLPEDAEKNIILDLEGDTCVDSTLGACMLFRTKDIIENNLFFDEFFFLYYSDDDLCRRIKKMKKFIIQVYESKCIHQHGIIKVKNKYIKKFIREYNFTFDRYYYFFKINKHLHIINEYKKKIPLYTVRFFLKILTFDFLSAIELISKYYAYYKFKSKILKNKI